MIDTALRPAARQGIPPALLVRLVLTFGFAALATAWWPLAQAWTVAADTGTVIEQIELVAGGPLTAEEWSGHMATFAAMDGHVLYDYPLVAMFSTTLAFAAATAIVGAGYRSRWLVGTSVAAPIVTVTAWIALAMAHGSTIRIVATLLE